MEAEEYTTLCKKRAERIMAELAELAELMELQGDTARAMDVREAITYVTSSVET